MKFGYRSSVVRSVSVAKDASVTANFALVEKAVTRVTGTVKDGSGHGWPLYAVVEVAGQNVAPTADPATCSAPGYLPGGSSGTCALAAGGLVIGQVNDRNTRDRVAGASVTRVDGAGGSATSGSAHRGPARPPGHARRRTPRSAGCQPGRCRVPLPCTAGRFSQ